MIPDMFPITGIDMFLITRGVEWTQADLDSGVVRITF